MSIALLAVAIWALSLALITYEIHVAEEHPR